MTIRRVTEVKRGKTYWWVDLVIGGEKVTSTRRHRFWLTGQNTWRQAKYLKQGDWVLTLNGRWQQIESVVLRDDAEVSRTYNLEVEADHVFFVGKNLVLVHNGDTDDYALPVYEDPKDVPKAASTDMDHGDSQTKFPDKKPILRILFPRTAMSIGGRALRSKKSSFNTKSICEKMAWIRRISSKLRKENGMI